MNGQPNDGATGSSLPALDSSIRLPAPLTRTLWHAGQPGTWILPTNAAPHLPALLAAARAAAAPAGPSVINQAVAMLAQLPSKAAGDDDAALSLQIYRIGLKELPRDLLALAVKRAASACKWRPTPRELLDLVADEFAERRRAFNRLDAETALAAAALPPPRPMTPEEQAAAEGEGKRLMAEFHAKSDAALTAERAAVQTAPMAASFASAGLKAMAAARGWIDHDEKPPAV